MHASHGILPVGSRLSRRWLWTLLSLVAPELKAQTLLETETLQRSFDHSNGVWAARFWQTSQPSGDERFFLLDRAQFNRTRQTEAKSTQESARWTLGLGEQSEYFAEVNASGSWQRRLGDHQLQLELGISGAHFEGTAAFQDLEAQYLLAALGEDPGGAPGDSIEKSQDWGLDLGLADTYRVNPTLDLLLSAQARRNESRLDQRRRDRADLLVAGAGFSKRWSRVNWDSEGQVSQLSFQNLLSRDSEARTRRQDLSSLSSLFSTSLGPRLRAGIGYQLLQTSFTEGEKTQVEGPALSLARNSDGRLGWQARVALLKETTDDASEAQGFGAFSLSYLISPRSNLVLSFNKEINLEDSFTRLNSDRLLLTSEQEYTVQSSLAWDFQTGRSRWSLLLVQDEQSFAGGALDSSSASSSVSYRLSRATDLLQSLEIRRTRSNLLSEAARLTLQEEGLLDTDSEERRALIWTSSWRHRWASGSAAMRPYVSLDLSYEILSLAAIEENLYRASLMLAVGQELRL